MSALLDRIRQLVHEEKYRVSDHGDEELADDRIPSRDAISGLERSEVLQEYSDTGRGPSLLLLTYDSQDRPIHVVWGIAYDRLEGPAVLITAYRPDPARWTEDFRRRRS